MQTLAMIERTDAVLSRYADPAALLTEVERERAGRFRFDHDREDFIAAHLLVRACAARVLADGVSAEPDDLVLVQECATCGGPHGRPRIAEAPGLGVSLAHARGLVAACAGEGTVGIDVERSDRETQVLVDGVLSDAEARWVQGRPDVRRGFLELWVRKEALVKAGLGTLDDLPTMDLVAAAGQVATSWGGLRLTGFADPGECVAACATTHPVTRVSPAP